MPELPEVETTRCGIEPHLLQQKITAVAVRQWQLRWPVPADLEQRLLGQGIVAVRRRAKYLLLELCSGTLLVHLGMSGSLRIVGAGQPAARHDHIDIELETGQALRYTDPRRFGAVLWFEGDPLAHPLLSRLGPEPLSAAFTGEYLRDRAVGRKLPVKGFIMDSHVVVGVGNIYANEALFRAGIHPRRQAGRIALDRYAELVEAIKLTLSQAIASGGTTLRDFIGGDGRPGYFKQALQVYGRGGEPCIRCNTSLKLERLGQRSTVFCPVCQR